MKIIIYKISCLKYKILIILLFIYYYKNKYFSEEDLQDTQTIKAKNTDPEERDPFKFTSGSVYQG